MRILVIGATGFLGRKLIPELSKKYEVVCLVRKESRLELLEKNRAKIVVGDMLDKRSIDSALKGVDIVVHLASAHRKDNDKINVVGSRNIIYCCKKTRIKRIIFISSMAVKRKNPDGYGKMKNKIEILIKNSGLKYTILRPSMIYSANNLSLIGKTIKMFPFFIPVIGDGKYLLSPVYIDDVVTAICKMIENKKSINKTYEIASPEKLKFDEIIAICKKQFKIHKLIIHIPIKLCLFIFKLIPIVNLDAVRGINEDTNADIRELKKDVEIKPLNFKEGIKNVNL